MRKYAPIILPCLLFIVGLTLHVLGIDSRPVWFDEAASLRLAHTATWAELVARSVRDVHPPLFYLLLKSWILITEPLGPSFILARVLTILINVGFLYATFLFVKEVTKTRVESFSKFTPIISVIYLISSQHIAEQAWSARMYGLSGLLFMLSNLMLIKVLEARSVPLWHYLSFSLLTLLASFTHYFLLLSILAQAAFILWCYRGREAFEFSREKILKLIACFIPTILGYITWAPTLMAQFTTIQKDYWSNPFTHSDITIALGQLAFPSGRLYDIDPLRDWWITIAVVAVISSFTYQSLVKKDWRSVLLSFLVIAPTICIFLLSHGDRNYFQPRALSFIWPAILIIFAALFSRIKNQGIGILLAAFTIFPLAFHTGTQIVRDYSGAYGGAATAARVLQAQARSRDVVVVTNPLTYLAIESYIKGTLPLMLVTKSAPADHWQGGAFLHEGEGKNESALSTIKADKIWFVHSDGYQWKEVLAPPADWTRLSSISIPERLFYQGTIVIEELVSPAVSRQALKNKKLTKQDEPWRYSFELQPKEWKNPGFTDTSWESATGSFGNPVLVEFTPKNSWISDQIWLRKETSLPASLGPLSLWARYVGTIEVALNGEPAAVSSANVQGYREFCIPPAAAATLRPGMNLITVHAYHQTSKGYVDVTLAPSLRCKE